MPAPHTPSPARPERLDEIDAVKALGILVVVLIHTVRSPWEPGASHFELWLGHATRFAVPGFLAASGYLYAAGATNAAGGARASVPFEATRRRLVRIALPYLVFSLAAQAVRHARGMGPATGSVASDLLLAHSFGPYYYVLVAAAMVVATPALARLSTRGHVAAFAAAFAVQGWLEIYSRLDFTWHLRNPLLWLAYFELGWLARIARDAGALPSGARAAAAALAFAAAAAGALASLWSMPPQPLARAIEWLAVYGVLAAAFLAARARAGAARRGVRALSDATYSIYLSHLLFLPWLRDAFAAPPGVVAPSAIALPWLGALLASLALVALGRAALGSRSRVWLGA
ncbi:MAG: acyltransferase family protein [Myxococcota bacterium]